MHWFWEKVFEKFIKNLFYNFKNKNKLFIKYKCIKYLMNGGNNVCQQTSLVSSQLHNFIFKLKK